MSDNDRCQILVWERPWYLHLSQCGRPVKQTIRTVQGDDAGVCGIHAKVHSRHPLQSFHFHNIKEHG